GPETRVRRGGSGRLPVGVLQDAGDLRPQVAGPVVGAAAGDLEDRARRRRRRLRADVVRGGTVLLRRRGRRAVLAARPVQGDRADRRAAADHDHGRGGGRQYPPMPPSAPLLHAHHGGVVQRFRGDRGVDAFGQLCGDGRRGRLRQDPGHVREVGGAVTAFGAGLEVRVDGGGFVVFEQSFGQVGQDVVV